MSDNNEVRVLAVSAQGLTTPSFRVRVLLLRPELAHYGVQLEPSVLFAQREAAAFYRGSLWRRATVLLSARRRLGHRLSNGSEDVVFIQRQVDLLPGLGLERRAIAGRRLVWDVDDAIWLDTSAAAGGHKLSALKGTKRKVKWLAARADHIVAANAYLADFLGQYSSRITIVPSVVETRSVRLRRHEDRAEFVLGWIGSSTTAPYLSPLAPAISRVSRELSNRSVRLLVVGGTMRDESCCVVEEVPWSMEHELEALGRIDVGVMPMPDNPWTRGKSAYKALQYMSAAIPVVADDVGVAASLIQPGHAGFVVRGEDEWVEALVTLARDAHLRTQFGEHGRRRVEKSFSVTRWAPTVAQILRDETQIA